MPMTPATTMAAAIKTLGPIEAPEPRLTMTPVALALEPRSSTKQRISYASMHLTPHHQLNGDRVGSRPCHRQYARQYNFLPKRSSEVGIESAGRQRAKGGYVIAQMAGSPATAAPRLIIRTE